MEMGNNVATMEDNFKAHDRERKRIVRSKPEILARQNALQRELRALKRQQAINPYDDNIKPTKCVQTPSLYSPVLVLSRILLILPLQLFLPAPIAS
ncbi:hypothetical protein CDAR_471 [Caerostris darwini]|uniref:Uncharacterized protein n=1 Tax=Caerostris darwini TaxID=1538125 RepID=A0AAV4UCC3_9ARAC|nr:hypothetical protein CDAR_471 [Caerostris darwini]